MHCTSTLATLMYGWQHLTAGHGLYLWYLRHHAVAFLNSGCTSGSGGRHYLHWLTFYYGTGKHGISPVDWFALALPAGLVARLRSARWAIGWAIKHPVQQWRIARSFGAGSRLAWALQHPLLECRISADVMRIRLSRFEPPWVRIANAATERALLRQVEDENGYEKFAADMERAVQDLTADAEASNVARHVAYSVAAHMPAESWEVCAAEVAIALSGVHPALRCATSVTAR